MTRTPSSSLPAMFSGAAVSRNAAPGPTVARILARGYVKKDHRKVWSEVQEIYRQNSPAAAEEMCRLALEAEDERTRAVCAGMVMERVRWYKYKCPE
jgi:hypothetical protein